MTMQVRLLNEKHIHSVIPTRAEIVALVEKAYRLDSEGKVEVPTKIGVHPDRDKAMLYAMPAWVGGARALGMKWVSYFPGNFARGLPDSNGLIVLNHPDHGMPCCIMEGMYVTFLRTAACGAIAAKYLVPRAPKTLGLVGCGGLGRWSLRIMNTVFSSIEHVFVSSRTPTAREAFCTEMKGEGSWTIVPVSDPLQAVRGMDIVVTSIPPSEVKPVTGEAFSPGTIFIPLDLVNSWCDDVLISATRIIADDPSHFSTRVRARSTATFPALQATVKIQDLVSGQAQSSSPSDRNVVAVCGIASTDVVLGWEIYRRACAEKVGLEFDMRG
jgi:alanine dehydrogenase